MEAIGTVLAREPVTGHPRKSLPPTPSPDPGLARDGLPHCTACNDTRRINVRLERPGPHDEVNRLDWCPVCGHLAQQQQRSRLYQRYRERIARYTQETGRYIRQTFAAFDQRKSEGRHTVSIRKAYAAARQFAADPKGWLVFYGTKGTGKTHLAAAIANALESRPEQTRLAVMLITAPDLLDLLRSGYNAGDYDDLLNLARTVSVLILDDLGVEKENEWVTEKLFQILNRRYQAELPTVIITNCRLEELEPRIYDRLSDDDLCTRCQILAPSYRQRRSSPGAVIS